MNGCTLIKTSEQLQGWAEYFHTILNTDKPDEPLSVSRRDRYQLQNKKGNICQEIQQAIHQTKIKKGQ